MATKQARVIAVLRVHRDFECRISVLAADKPDRITIPVMRRGERGRVLFADVFFKFQQTEYGEPVYVLDGMTRFKG
jgi:hypothetical protein